MPMLVKPIEICAGCELYEKDHMGFVAPEGQGTLGVLIMGEAGGRHERAAGLPFRPTAPAGSVLERAIRRAGFSRQQFRIANAVNCTPPNDWLVGAPWEFGAITHCHQHRRRIWDQMKPRAVLALGNTAFSTLTEFVEGIQKMRGYPILTQDWGMVLGSYHPSFLVRGNMRLLGVLIHDIQKAVALARGGGWRPTFPNYQTNPTLSDALAFEREVAAHPDLPLAFDIETDMSPEQDEDEREDDAGSIVQIQLALRPETGIALPWIGGFVEVAKRLLQTPNAKLGHNIWDFDIPKLRDSDAPVAGQTFDTLEAFRHLQRDLQGLYNLQSVASFYGMDSPWKHTARSDLATYGCCDVDAVQRIWAKLPADLRARGLW